MGKGGSKDSGVTFRATIVKVGPIYAVDVSERTSRALGATRGPTPVVLSLAGSTARRTTMTPRRPSGFRVAVHGELRREAGVGLGDTVAVTLRLDREPPGVELAADLEAALREADALAAFRALGPAHQRELAAYVEKAARESTRTKYIARVVERACEKRERQLDAEASASSPRRRVLNLAE